MAAMNTAKINVVVLSQQRLLRQGIEHSLSGILDMVVSATAEVSDAILSSIEVSPPDVVLLDLEGNAEQSLLLARKIKQRSPSVSIVALTSSPGDEQLFEVLKAQASAYVSKDINEEQLEQTIRRVGRGEHPINDSLTDRPKVAEQVLMQFQELSKKSEAEAFISPLTPREMEILKHIGKGMLNKQIATELGISEQTIKNHVTSILRKLNANARTEAVVVAIKQGLITI